MTETQVNINAVIRKEALKNGLYLGVAVLALSIISFYVAVDLVSSPYLIVGSGIFFAYLAPFILSVFFAFRIKLNVLANLTYRQLVTGIFIMVIICYGILIVGQEFVFAKIIEPHMAQKTELAMEKSERLEYRSEGLNQSQIDSTVAEKQKMFNSQIQSGIGPIIMHYAIYIILLFAVSLIIGLMVNGSAGAKS